MLRHANRTLCTGLKAGHTVPSFNWFGAGSQQDGAVAHACTYHQVYQHLQWIGWAPAPQRERETQPHQLPGYLLWQE
jgi:hypothetical protein